MWESENCFTLCKRVLEKYPDVSVAEMDQRRKEMTFSYSRAMKIDYGSEVTHCAYIRSDLTLHAFVVSRIISYHSQLSSLFQSQESPLTIVSVGCGPGSDMIGVLRYVSQYLTNPPALRFTLYDSVPEWQKPINLFENIIRRPQTQPQPESQSQSESQLQRDSEAEEQENQQEEIILPPCFEKTFYTWNLTSNPSEFIDYPSFTCADLFIFSMIFSDVFRQSQVDERENVKTNLERVCNCAKIGSLFLIIDVDQSPPGTPGNPNLGYSPSKMRDIPGFPLDSFLQGTAFTRPTSNLNFEEEFSTKEEYQLPAYEEKNDLGPYFSEDGRIKLRAHLYAILYRKIEPEVQIQSPDQNENPHVQQLQF